MNLLKRFFFVMAFCIPATARLQNAHPNTPALIPTPTKLRWMPGHFRITPAVSINYSQDSLSTTAVELKTVFQQKGLAGITTQLSLKIVKNPAIYLSILPHYSQNREGYRLVVLSSSIRLESSTKEGLFRGIQTLSQLLINGNRIPACVIEDAPAFSWRGFMVDVGRNYQSMAQLKQQIDVMAAYKLNVFHFHLTEDLAWRWQMKSFPALTSTNSMERWKGKFYSREEILELERYCRRRYITMVPEIDIPGHSKAFTRALGTDMQSDSGVAILKTILKEVAEDYPFRWLHIGGDEVKVKKKNYLKEIATYAHGLGLSTMAWDPGAELDETTVRQLWMREGV